MNCLKRIAIQSGLMLMSTAAVLPLYADIQLYDYVFAQNSKYRQDTSTSAQPHLDNEYLIPADSGILNIEHTAFAVIRLKQPLPASTHFFLNGEQVNFRKVDATGTVLKCETNNLRDKWLEITGPQVDIRHLLTFKDL